jgi:hypothetical protein
MTDADLEKILESVDAALNVYRKNEPNLPDPDLRLKGMLLAVRLAIEDDLGRERSLSSATARSSGKMAR